MSDLLTPIDGTKPVYEGDELLILENFVDSSKCEEWVNIAEAKSGVSAPVGIADVKEGAGNVVDKQFIADRINLVFEPKIKSAAKELFARLYGVHVKEHFGVDIEWFEMPHILRYTRGGNYNYHADSESWDEDEQRWVKGIDRDYSVIVYLNSKFTGGALVFPDLNLRLRPKPGLVVLFPSDHRFLHMAEETLSGTRYVMVTWAAEKGVKRVLEKPPRYAVYLDK